MFERVVTGFKELISMIAKRRVQKATENIDAQHESDIGSPTPNLDSYLEAKGSEEVQYGKILNNVDTTAQNTTAVRGTETRPPKS